MRSGQEVSQDHKIMILDPRCQWDAGVSFKPGVSPQDISILGDGNLYGRGGASAGEPPRQRERLTQA